MSQPVREVDPSGRTPQVAPWGSPHTPLLPRWYRDNIPNVRLSAKIRAENPAVTTVAQLKTFWDSRSEPIDDPIRRSLLHIANTYPPPSSLVVIPADVDRLALLNGPLGARTANTLRRGVFEHLPGSLSVDDLLTIPNFGMTSLLELMCVAEAMGLASTEPPVAVGRTEQSISPSDAPDERTVWVELEDVLELLLAAASEFHGAVSVADALQLDLAALASDLGIVEAVDTYRIRDLTDVRVLASVIDDVRDLRATMPERKLAILEQYLFARKRTTLEKLGQAFGVTRERIRQIKNRIVEEIEERVGPEVAIIVATLSRRIGPVVNEDDLRLYIDELFDGELINDPAIDITRRIVGAALTYDCVRGVCANHTARDVFEEFRAHAAELADDVGLIDEEALRASLPDETWHRFFELLAERCGLVRVSDRLAFRSTKKARAKAAILSIGRLATIEEIAAESGLPRTHLGGLLSGIPGVARASMTKWGIGDWVDDEYEGIAEEIKQRIEEDGGSTTMARLVTELPELFEVKEASVRALVATPQFILCDGEVRMAKESEVRLRDLYDVVDGVTAEGWPYWSFRVHESYFDGYSLAGVPPEIADALGCPKNGRIRATVIEPAGCRRISVNWQLTSVSGASVGYISTALNRLGVAEGDRVSLAVVEPSVAAFRRFDRERDRERRSGGRPTRDELDSVTRVETDVGSSALLERLKSRRQVF